MYKDRTAKLEEEILNREYSDKFYNLIRLLKDRFGKGSSAGILYITTIAACNLLLPFLAFWWKAILELIQKPSGFWIPAMSLAGYALFLSIQKLLVMINSTDGEYIWRYDIVHENRFMERILYTVYTKVMRLPAEYFEVPEINDVVERGLQFTGKSLRTLYVKFYTFS